MIVVIEGADATGKSTLCKNLALAYGGIVYDTPPAQMKEKRSFIDRFATSEESFQFYYEGIKIAATEICQLKEKYDWIFVDRYWISTAATHLGMGVDVSIEKLVKLDCADLTILLKIGRAHV